MSYTIDDYVDELEQEAMGVAFDLGVAKELLRQNQFSRPIMLYTELWDMACMTCGGMESKGHKPDCALAAALR